MLNTAANLKNQTLSKGESLPRTFPPCPCKSRSNIGFTLMELMVVVSIAGILAGLAAPSFTAVIRSNRLTTYTNEFVTALNYARSEAVKRGASVTVRKVDKFSATNLGNTAKAAANWEEGWDVFVDANNDSKYSADEVLVRTYPALKTGFTLRGGISAAYVRYGSLGQADSGNAIFTLCDDSDDNGLPEANTSKYLTIVGATGRVRIMPDTDDPQDGIPDLNNGTNIASCG